MRLLGRFSDRPAFTPRTVALRASALQEGFFLSLRAAGRTELTLRWYQARLERLIRELRDPAVESIGADAIRRWLVGVKARGVRDTYVESHRRAASSMFAWAVREGILARSPMATVGRVRADSREITFPTLEEIDRLIAAQPSTAEGIRNRAIITLLYDTGMRVGELVGIERADMDLDEGSILIRRSKSRRERRVPILPRTRMLIWSYITRARPRPLFATSDHLFLSRRAVPLTPHAVYQWLRRSAAPAGVDVHKVHPHAFRHAFITESLRAGMNESTVMQITGIRTPTVLRRYTHLAYGDVRRPHATLSPAARLAV